MFQKPTSAELANRYVHHPPKGDQAHRYEMIRSLILHAANGIVELTPLFAGAVAGAERPG